MSFREDVMSGNIDWHRLQTSYRLRILLENMLQIDPAQRWDASFLLTVIQEDFAIEIQRVWRGYIQRKRFRQVTHGLVKIQSLARGFVQKRRFKVNKTMLRQRAILTIQSAFRGFLQRRKYKQQRSAIMKCQANVLARQQRRAYLRLKQDAALAQAYIKRFLAMAWYRRVKEKNEGLNQALKQITEKIGEYNDAANRFKTEFT